MENCRKINSSKKKTERQKTDSPGYAGRHFSDSGGNGTFPHHPRGTVPGI